MGREEAEAAYATVSSGVLSGFLGEWGPDFFGGPNVIRFEEAIAEMFNVDYAVSFNSWTSGLTAALGAIGIEPGDEVIVPPFTMAASATAILHWNAIPVFAGRVFNSLHRAQQALDTWGRNAISPGRIKLSGWKQLWRH